MKNVDKLLRESLNCLEQIVRRYLDVEDAVGKGSEASKGCVTENWS